MKLRFFLYTFILSLLASCNSSSGDSDIPNSAPTASSVTIIDGNGGNAVVGDSLKGSYIYADVDGDAEGLSRYSWLRNDSIIGGATGSIYTLVPADMGLHIMFEVTPIALTGNLVGDTSTSSGLNIEIIYMISHKNFSLLAEDTQPVVIDPTTGVFTKTDVTMTIFIGDRNNQIVTNNHTVFFQAEYGLITPSCITSNGFCSVTWSAIKRPDPSGPGDDMQVTIIAYAVGEESFTDTNGNSLFDDGDTTFDDLEEPYIDADESNSFTAGDVIVDVINGNDITGVNGAHDIGDTFFNGPGCTHSSLCSAIVVTNGNIWDSITLKIDGPPP